MLKDRSEYDRAYRKAHKTDRRAYDQAYWLKTKAAKAERRRPSPERLRQNATLRDWLLENTLFGASKPASRLDP
jgi:hypothetical protein